MSSDKCTYCGSPAIKYGKCISHASGTIAEVLKWAEQWIDAAGDDTTLQGRVDELEGELEEAEDDLRESRRELDDANAIIRVVEDALSDLRAGLNVANERIAELEAEDEA